MPRKRHLSAEEIRTFWGALDVATCEPNIKALLRFMLLTGRRRSEALLINAREIDREQSIWCLPASRMKNGKDFFLPLPPMALEVLDAIGTDEKTGYYFVSARTGQPYEPRSIDHACRDLFLPRRQGTKSQPALYGTERIVPHDLRRTAATHMRALGISREDVKFVLGHTEADVLGRHYDKHDGLNEKRRALQLWTSYVADLLTPKTGNVVSISRVAAE
jgi:integrase